MNLQKVSIGLIQTVSLLLVLFLSKLLPLEGFMVLVAAMTLTHYICSLYYSAPALLGMFQSRRGLLNILGMILLVYFSFRFQQPGLLFYFGLHHSLSETWVLQKQLPHYSISSTRSLFMIRFAFHSVVYAHLSKTSGMMDFISHEDIFIALCAMSVLYLAVVMFSRLPDRSKDNLFISDGLFIFLALMAYYDVLKFDFFMLDLYHCIYWILLPVVGLHWREGTKASTRFFGMNVVLALGSGMFFYILNRLVPSPMQDGMSSLVRDFLTMGGYIHIGMGFFLLNVNHFRWRKNPEAPLERPIRLPI
ncbi:hypothetical protein [Bdellovibrio sp. HCB2-146]|uniref:hypothetical protein n=1 Tax=Bdellovibrio sp. HCB2-146 TaxID=3394362 RepID=UPI0039BCA65F